MKAKKLLVLMLSLLVLIGVIAGMTSCDIDIFGNGEDNGECKHVWKDATCTDPQICQLCEAKKGEALGHTGGSASCDSPAVCERCNQPYGQGKDHNWVEATCTDPKHCTVCGAVDGKELGHVGGNATCESAAICDRCKNPYGEAAGHDWVEATCTEAKHCKNCSATVGEALGHTGGKAYCNELAICDRCSESYGELGTHEGGTATCTKGAICDSCHNEYTEPNGHKWNEATCTEAKHCESCGITEGAPLGHTGGSATCQTLAICQRCGVGYGTLSSHDYSAKNTDVGYIAVRGDCVTAATYYYSCSVCGDKDLENTFPGTAPVGHSFGEYETVDGVHTRTCSVCHTPESGECAFVPGAEKGSAATCEKPAVCSTCQREYGEALGHSWGEGSVTTAPTCTESGVRTYTCGNCSGTKTEAIEPTGHSFGEFTVTTPATCTVAGTRTAKCACGEEKVETISATGHKPGPAATCETAQVCTVCGNEIAPATGHSYVLDHYDAATCTKARVNYYECSSCGADYNEPVGTTTQHNIVGVEPTQTLVEGETCLYDQYYECNDCGTLVEGETVTNHVKWTAAITAPATCVSEGIKTLTCEACGETKTEAIEADSSLGHAWGEGVTADGVTTYTCTRCNDTKTVKLITSGDKVSGSDLDNELQVGEDTNFELDDGVKDVIGDQEVSVSAGKIEGDDKLDLGLTKDQLDQIGNNPVYDFTIEGENGLISDFTDANGKKNYITVTLPYTLSEGEDVDSIAIWFINDKGEVEAIKATYNDGFVTFQTDHFSRYTVTRLTPKQRCALYGHSSSFTHVDPTCTENGYTLEFCIRCGYSNKVTLDEDKAFGHDYVESIIPATCTEAGSATYTCATCKHSYTTVIAALNHNYVETSRTDATCMAPGSVVFECDREGCEASYTEVLTQLDHAMTERIYPSTCVSGGYTEHYCENKDCDYSYNDSYTAPLGHDYIAELEWDGDKVPHGNPNNGKYGHVTVKLVCQSCGEEKVLTDDDIHLSDEIDLPNCTSKGSKRYIVRFTFNGKVHEYKVKDDAFFGDFRHEYGEGFNKFDDEHHWSECKCGDKKHESEHKFGKGIVTKAATCTAEGEITYSCECGYTKTESIPKTSHSFSGGWTYDENSHWRVCSICESVEAVSEHSFGEGVVTKAATCAVEGELSYRCACGYTKTEIIPTTDNHKYNKKDIKFDEYTHWYECRTCHGKVEEAVHSDSEAVVIKPATCTEAGESKVECACGFADIQIILPLGHSFTEYNSNNDAQCGIDGTKTALCDHGCGKTDTVIDEGSALEHSFTNYVSNGDATCTADGTKTAYCDYCGKETNTVTDEGSKIDHIFTNYVSNGDATCTADGTKTAVCDTCGKETDTVIDEGSTIDHFAYKTEIIKPATCTEDGEALITCVCGHSWTEIIASEGGSHVYDKADVLYDETSHWYVCTACGEIADLEEHTVADTVINGGTSCEDPSEKVELCSCGYVISTEIIPGGNHPLTETVTVDFSELGTCYTGTFSYQSCICGATTSVDLYAIEDILGSCNMEEGENDEGVNEDGTPWMSSEVICSDCGMYGYVYATATMDGCKQILNYVLTLSKDGVAIIENISFSEDWYNHNTHSEKLELTDYCGGYISVERCTECGEITYVGDMNPKCEIGEPEVREETVDGVTRTVMSATCPNCGLYFEVSEWRVYEIEGGCAYYEYMRVVIADGENIIVDYTDASYYDAHDYEVTYELNGESCLDGVKITRTCKACGESYSYEDSRHISREFLSIDLSQYTPCGGYLSGAYCSVCEQIIEIEKFDVQCKLDNFSSKEEVIDGITYVITEGSCSECGLYAYTKEWREYGENSICEYYECTEIVITIGDTELVSFTQKEWRNNHNYEYNYELKGETCDDGYTVYEYCTVCGWESSWNSSGHRSDYQEFYLNEYGICDGRIYVHTCQICGITTDYSADFGCKFEYDRIDDDGYLIEICVECGAVRMTKTEEGEKDEKCYFTSNESIILLVDGNEIINLDVTRRVSQHNFEHEYNMLGESCTDGYTVRSYCVDCGLSSGEYISYMHQSEYVSIDLSEFSTCGGIISGYKCNVCGEFERIDDLKLECGVAETEPEMREEVVDGITYHIMSATCPECGLYLETKEWIKYSDEGECTYYEYYSMKIALGEEVILSSTSRTYYNEHDMVTEIELYGETCDDGYRVIERCLNCDYYNEYENWGHEYRHYEIKTPCGSYFYGEKCSVCNVWIMGDGDLGCCDSENRSYDSFTEDGITYERMQFTCDLCGYNYTVLYGTEGEGCQQKEINRVVIEYNGEILLDYAEIRESGEHSYERTYELNGESCSDGYTVYEICTVCGESSSYYGTGHMIDRTDRIDLVELGIPCGGYAQIDVCSICNETVNNYVNTYCNFYHDGVDENGNNVARCSRCGAVRYNSVNYGDKDENCTQKVTYTYIFIVNDVEVFNYETVNYNAQHNYVETVTMFGESCEDGYTVVGTCTDCGCGYERTDYYHENKVVKDVDFASYGCCPAHYFRSYKCYCGQYESTEWDSYNYSYNSYTRTYSCSSCSAQVKITAEDVVDGCNYVTETRTTLWIGDEAIAYFASSESYVKHDLVFTATVNENGALLLGAVCSKCGFATGDSDENASIAELTYNEEIGGYCYDLFFTPEQSGYYAIYSTVNWDTFVTLYTLDGEYYNQISSDDDGGNNSNFKLECYLEAGVTYVYRIRNYNVNNSSSVTYVLAEGKGVSECNHYFVYDRIFIEGADNCEEGVVSINYCERCGYLEHSNLFYHHDTYEVERIDLSAYGICGDYAFLTVYSCLCGREGYVNYDYGCYMTESWDYITDDNGVNHELYTIGCAECGLTIVRDYCDVTDGCKISNVYKYNAYVGEEHILVDLIVESNVRFNHNYGPATYEFLTEDHNCESGVILHYECLDCGAVNDETHYSHVNTLVGDYDLTDYGVCGGYVNYYACPCEKYKDVSYNVHCSYGSSVSNYVDDNGVNHTVWTYTCVNCGFVHSEDAYTVKEGCYLVSYSSFTFVMGDETIISVNNKENSRSVSHDYKYEYIFDSESHSCEDGVTINVTCADCDYTESYYRTYHDYNINNVYYYTANYGACGQGTSSYINVRSCPCGESTYYRERIYDCRFDSSYDNYTDDNGVEHELYTKVCSKCGLTIVRDSYREVDGCKRIDRQTYTVSIGDKVIIDGFEHISSRWEEHNYGIPTYTFNTEVENCESGVTVHYVCSECEYSYDDICSYHSNILKERYELSDYGVCGGYVEYRECPCGETAGVNISTNCMNEGSRTYYRDDTGVGHVVWTYTCSECGLVRTEDSYIATEGCNRVTYTSYTLTVGDTEIIAINDVRTSTSAAHSYQYSYVFDTEVENCENGVTVNVSCANCEYTNSYRRTYHDNYAGDVIYYLGDYGACDINGYIRISTCPCGYYSDFTENVYCSMSGSWNYFTDDNGVYHEVYTRVCTECGLTIVRDQHPVYDGCYVKHVYTYTVSIGDTVIIDSYDRVYSRGTNHTYGVPTYEFDTDVENCENGVTVHYVCENCDYSYDDHYYNHSTFLMASYELSDYNACGGGEYDYQLRFYSCACGLERSLDTNNIVCSFSEEVSRYVDANGINRIKHNYVCSECGLVLVRENYAVYEGCYRVTYTDATYTMDGETIVSYDHLYRSTRVYHDYQYEYIFDSESNSCEDGVTVNVTCSNCEYTDTLYRDYHDTSCVVTTYYLGDYGSCSHNGYIRLYTCPCGYATSFDNGSIYDCSMTSSYDYYTDDDGISHEVYNRACTECGLTIVRDSYTVADGCDRITYYTYTVSVGENTVVEGFNHVASRWQSHTYGVPTYTFDTEVENCENGVTVHFECLDCGYSYDDRRTYHSNDLRESYNLADYGACEGYVNYYGCPCGYSANISISTNCSTNGNNEYYVNDKGVSCVEHNSVCTKCALVRNEIRYVLKEGCERVTYRTYSFKLGETVIFSCEDLVTGRSTNHDYRYETVFDNGGDSCEDGVTINVTCADCNYTDSYYRTGHSRDISNYYYLSDFGVCGVDSYIRTRSCACGYSTSVSENVYYCSFNNSSESYVDANGVEHSVNTRVCSSCNLTIIRDTYTVADGCDRIQYRDYTVKVGDEVVFEDFHNVYSRSTSHSYGIPTYEFDTEVEDCESGVNYHFECTECGYSYDSYYNHHEPIRKEYYDLTEYGACSGYVEYLECACGEKSSVNHNFCYNSHTNNNYYDEEGVYHYVNAYSCSTCGLRFQDDYPSVRDSSTCTRINNHNIYVSVGAVFVTEINYVTTSTEHDYVVTGELKNGATSCTDGVVITHTCRDCEYSYSNNYTSHQMFEVERYDMQSLEYGSALCEGYLTRLSCACGKNNSMDYTSLCHFGNYGESCWIDNIATGWIYTAENPYGGNHMSVSTYRMTCSVTDPEQCGYTVRYTTYWLYGENECVAYQYQTWQLGYDMATGTCAYEITFKTGNSYTAHPYVRSDINETWENGNTKEQGTRYDCPNCGSYYYHKDIYNENGEHIGYDQLFENKLNDGRRKLYQEYREYENGNTVLQLYRYVSADDVETWDKYEYSRNNSYVGPFGDSGYEYEEKYSNHNTPEGQYDRISQHAYVYYKGHTYYIYEYNFYSAYWEKYDYTYNFNGTCERTTHHTTSYGTDETVTETDHRAVHTEYTLYPTCTQDGYYNRICDVCESILDANVLANPYDHSWYCVSQNFYICTRCGIENINGASGDIVMEDLTDKYGNGENYVAGYWARNSVQFVYYVSLWLYEPMEDGNDQIVLDGIEIFELDNVRALAFSKSAVIAAAEALGYFEGEYDVSISFVPVGSDGSYDYSVIFDSDVSAEISDSATVNLTVDFSSYEELTITPAVSGTWTFGSLDSSFDVHGDLYDENGNILYTDDDGNGYPNFGFQYYLEEGKTYVLRVRHHSNGNSGTGYVNVYIVAPVVE